MANSRFEYVRAYERADDRRLLPGCYAVVRLDGRGFTRFSRRHAFAKPNDARALRLMDAAAAEVLRAFPEVALAYGQSDEYSFLLRRGGSVPLFDRRPTKLATLFASTFAAAYCRFWPRFFGGGGGGGGWSGGGGGQEGATAPTSPSAAFADAATAAASSVSAADPLEPRARRRARPDRGDDGDAEDEDDGDEDEDEAALPLVSLEPGAFEHEERDAAEGRRAIAAARAAERASAGESAGADADADAADADAAAAPPPAAAAAPAPEPLRPTPLRSTPAFDARCVEYPTARTVRDYFAWRQADAHINNQYNTAFWALVQRGGLPPRDAQQALKGTGAGAKNEIMFACGINYNGLPQRYRKGSVICWEECDDDDDDDEVGGPGGEGAREEEPAPRAPPAAKGRGRRRRRLALRHCDIVRDAFGEARPEILDEGGDAGDGSGRGAGGRRP